MKKISVISIILAAMMIMVLSACDSQNDNQTDGAQSTPAGSTDQTSQTSQTLQPSAGQPSGADSDNTPSETPDVDINGEDEAVKIKLTVNGEVAIVNMLDNDAAKDLISMLPLTLTFEEYNSTEKIASLPRELNLGSAPTSCDPDVGSFTYYAPWGNLAVFYNDFRQSNNLIPLGTFESGLEHFTAMSGNTEVTIEIN